MPGLHELEAEGIRAARQARICDLQSRREIHLSTSHSDMHTAQPSQPLDSASPTGLARSIDEQFETFRKLAERQYPEDKTAQLRYEMELVKSRLREYATKVTPLQVREM